MLMWQWQPHPPKQQQVPQAPTSLSSFLGTKQHIFVFPTSKDSTKKKLSLHFTDTKSEATQLTRGLLFVYDMVQLVLEWGSF